MKKRREPRFKSNINPFLERIQERADARIWALVSWIARMRVMIPLVNRGACIACGKPYKFEELQAGHFHHGKADWHLGNIHGQCNDCNQHHGGRLKEYEKFLQKKYTPERIQAMSSYAHKVTKYTYAEKVEVERWLKAIKKFMKEEEDQKAKELIMLYNQWLEGGCK